jgi:GT2 family glycosyltransferase
VGFSIDTTGVCAYLVQVVSKARGVFAQALFARLSQCESREAALRDVMRRCPHLWVESTTMNQLDDTVAVSIVIANWNGEGLIRRCLSSVLVALRVANLPVPACTGRQAGLAGELIVVDDASGDESCEIIRAEFPQVRLLENPRNVGFIPSVNRGVKAARGAIVILLNNDIVVESDFVRAIVAPLRDDRDGKVFAVSARTVSWTDNQPNHVLMKGRFRRGRVALEWSDPKPCGEPQATLFVQGGSCAVRRDIFLRLGGFQPVFHPGYWEDYDLSYLAARCGYASLYEPRSLAFHLGKVSMRRSLGDDALRALKQRNEFIFTWLNITDAAMLLEHFLLLPVQLFSELWRGEGFGRTKAFIQAAARLPAIMRVRAERRLFHRVPDRKILRR